MLCLFFGGEKMICIWLLLFFLTLGVQAETVLFEMYDPSGDDYGNGKLTYPTHQAFAPFRDLFDLISFKVTETEEYLLMDVSFSQITNPWKAPEGFFHQHVLVFINTEELGADYYKPLDLRFDKTYEYVIRIAPWSLSSLTNFNGDELADLTATMLNNKTIRAFIPLEKLKQPQKTWEYIVVCGGYDPFGKDFFREVILSGSQWEFGGEQKWPIVDILATSFGGTGQKKQLETGVLIFLHSSKRQTPIFWWVLAIAFFFGLVFFLKWRGFYINWGLKLSRREHTKKGNIKKWGFFSYSMPKKQSR